MVLTFKLRYIIQQHGNRTITIITQTAMKKKADFMEQIKNSEQFLNKLNNFKKASKQIKDKNKLVSHRNIWVKQYKYLTRLQRDQDLDNVNYFELFDQYFGYEMEERQIFGKDKYKSYSEIIKRSEEEIAVYEANIWQQLKSLPLLVSKVKDLPNNQTIDLKDAQGMLKDIAKYLAKQYQSINQQFDKLQIAQLTASKVAIFGDGNEQNEGQYAFLQDLLAQHNFDDVKGFDFEANQLKRIEEGENYLKQYIQSLSDKLSEDEISSVINEYHHAGNLLAQTLELELQKISLDYEEALSLDNSMVSMSSNYQIINHIYNTYLGRGKSVSAYSERLGIEFPNVNRKVLQRVTEYIQAKIYKARKSNAVKRNFIRQKQQLLQKVEKEVNDRLEAKIKKAHKQAQRLQRKEEKIKLQKQLQELRTQYQQRKAQKQKIVQEQEEKQKQEQRKRDAVRKLYLDELSKKAAEVQDIKQKKEKEQQQKMKSEKLKKELQTKKQIEQNKPKVQQRHSMESKKLEKKLQEDKQRKQFGVKNQQRINNAIQKYSFRPAVEASEQRLNAPTEGMIKKRQTLYDKADKIELTKMTGYNINQLMGDRRFKLNTALFEAGLAGTDYARQVINRMSKRPDN